MKIVIKAQLEQETWPYVDCKAIISSMFYSTFFGKTALQDACYTCNYSHVSAMVDTVMVKTALLLSVLCNHNKITQSELNAVKLNSLYLQQSHWFKPKTSLQFIFISRSYSCVNTSWQEDIPGKYRPILGWPNLFYPKVLRIKHLNCSILFFK